MQVNKYSSHSVHIATFVTVMTSENECPLVNDTEMADVSVKKIAPYPEFCR